MTDQKERRAKTEKTKMREFGLTVGIAFGVLAALLFWRGKSNYIYLAVIAAVFILTGLVVPRILKPVNKVWMA